MDEELESEWECGSCGSIIDAAVADPGDDYHHPDEDCRAVRAFVPARDGATPEETDR